MSTLNQLHPGVFSTITADQTTYDTATGVSTMFVADVFEKGKDGEIEFISTPSEFLFKYGDPNYSKYGQSAYNVMNFLESGGQAYIMRVLPDDATYAHSVLNIQTKLQTDGKKVKLDDLSTVNVNDVHIRPTISLIKKNNLSAEMLESELLKDRSQEKTVDGYDNNFLLLVTPNGRGESYNNLGYRLSPNTSYGLEGQSRIYNFEVIRYEGNSASIIEGPFYVSLDPDTVSENSESMFIEEVVNKQSEHLNVKVNLNTLNRLANIINPDVKPTLLDVVTGGVYDDEPTLRFNAETKREEDIHLSLHKYNSAGYPVLQGGRPTVNTPKPDDPVQISLTSLDNSLRENSFIRASNKLQYMKDIFPTLSSDEFNELNSYLDSVKNTINSTIANELSVGTGDTLVDQYEQAKTNYQETASEDNLNKLNEVIRKISETIRTDIINESNKISAAYSLTEHNSPNPSVEAEYNTEVKQIISLLSRKDQINIFSVEHRSKIFDIQNDIASHQLGNTAASDIEGMTDVLNSIENEILAVYEDLVAIAFVDSDIPQEYIDLFDSNEEDSIMNRYMKALQLVADINDGIQNNDVKNRDIVYGAANDISNELLEVISKVAVSANSGYVDSVLATQVPKLQGICDTYLSSIESMITTDSTFTPEAVRENSRQRIQIEITRVNNKGSDFFNTSLVDFSNTLKLLLGSDGSFEYDSLGTNKERNKAIKDELIKAYTGILNPDVLNKDKIRFNIIFDARYDNDIKLAITNLARNSRQDFIFFADDAGPEFTVSPEDALEWRREDFNISSQFVAIYGQNLTYYDEYTGRDINFTPTYILASKIPQLATQYGLHYPLAGTRRGLIDGFKNISWTPNSAYREKLYVNKVNYIQEDSRSARFNSQLTAIKSSGPMSYVNNMFTLLEIKRGCEDLLVDYQFEFNDDQTIVTLSTELNNYLSRFISNRSCETISSDISSSDYDRQQRILRVNVSIKFTGVIERIVLNLAVEK